MTIEQCYERMEADYADVEKRLRNPRLIQKFMLKFLDDPSFGQLKAYLEEENWPEAFRMAHTLKGVSQNLSFKKLYETSAELTEALRAEGKVDIEALFSPVAAAYERTVEAISCFQKELEGGEGI